MKLKLIKIAATALLLSTSTANAALESRLGGLAVYDTDFDITWLADANAVAGTIYDDGENNNDGLVTFASAKEWVNNLSIDGITGWRLPGTNTPGDSTREYAHLFYSELSGTEFYPIDISTDPDLLLFSHINLGQYYWGGWRDDAIETVYGFIFGSGMFSGLYEFSYIDGNPVPTTSAAWAVHDGDPFAATPVPEPSTYAMLLAGLGLVGFGLKRQTKISRVNA